MESIETAKALFFEGLDLFGREEFAAAEEKFLAVLRIIPDRVSALTNLSATQLRLGKLDDARATALKVVAIDADSVDGWMNLGMIEAEFSEFEAAVAALKRVVAANPDHPVAWPLLAQWHDRLGQFREAVTCYKNALRLNPGEFQWLSNVGAILNDLREFKEALEYHEQSLRINPGQCGTLSNKGNTLYELRRYGEALAAHERALQLDPQYAEGWSNKANTLHALGRYAEALAAHEQALQLRPDYAEGWSNKANTLRALRRHDEALADYDRSIRIKPDYAEAWCNKGVALRDLKRFDEALAQYERALALRPDYADALIGKGGVLHELRRFDEALALYEQALKLRPDHAEAWASKGITLHELNRHDDALAAYSRALELQPDMDFQLGQLLHAKMKLCDWNGLDPLLEQLFRKVRNGDRVSTPFQVLALGDSEELNMRSAQAWVQARYPSQPQLPPFSGTPRQDRIRIAYYSADFHNHAAAYLTAEFFELHDKNRFEITALSFGPDRNDEMRHRIVRAMDRFIDVRDKSDREVAEMSRALGIDIAVDLKGHTEDSRLGLFAYRVAPVQVTYLGYPGTTGADYMDYLIADPMVIPEANRQWFSEKIVYLPDCYQINDSTRKIGEVTPARQQLGLPEHGFVFCCFNNNYKITPATFDGWMRIMRAVDGSVLWLVDDNAAVVRNLRAEAVKRGVAAERLVFAKRMDYAGHLARHRVADLFLDTLPYNAHTTASDALLAGLPVVTCVGKTFPGRVAASLLQAVGLPELIANNASAYEALAIDLATHPARLQAIRQKLAAGLPNALLFNTPQMTRQIEAAYRMMHERHHRGLPPDHLSVDRMS